MPTQKKSLVVVLREPDALFFIVTENFAQRVQAVPLALISRTLRMFAIRQRDVRDVYLIIDDIPVYHFLITDVQRQKEELAQVWDCSEFLAYREIRRENKYVYMGYSYGQAVLQKHIAIFKKTGLSCKGIIPADFLYAGPPVYIVQSNHRLRVRLFDGQGGIFATTLLKVPNDQREVQQIAQYAVREKILLPGVLNMTKTVYDPETLFPKFHERLLPSIILYTQESQRLHTKLRLSTSQKTILVFITLVSALAALMFAWSGYKIATIRNDIRFIQHQAAQLLPQANRLRELEVKTLWLKRLGPKASPEVAQLLGFVRQSKGILSELIYVAERKLISVVILDTQDRRNEVIKSCQQSKYYSAVNLIYIRPQGRYLEYKLILTVR